MKSLLHWIKLLMQTRWGSVSGYAVLIAVSIATASGSALVVNAQADMDFSKWMWQEEQADASKKADAPPFDKFKAMESVLNSLENAFAKFQPVSTSTGRNIVMYGLIILFTMRCLELVIAEKDLSWLVAEGLKIGVLAGFAVACFKAPDSWKYLTMGKDSFGEMLKGLLEATASGAGGGAANLKEAMSSWLTVIFSMIGVKILPDGAGIFYVISNLLAIIGTLLFSAVSIVAVSLAACLTVGHALVGGLLMQLAIGLGPLLVPTILFRPLNFLFDAWLKTILTGGMMKIVGAGFLAAGTGFATAIKTQTDALKIPPGSVSFWAALDIMQFYGMVFLVSLIFVLVAGALDQMARSLISGSGMSGFGLHAFRHAVQGVAGASGANAAGSGAAKGAKFLGHTAGSQSASREAGPAFQRMKSSAEAAGHTVTPEMAQGFKNQIRETYMASKGYGGAQSSQAVRRAAESYRPKRVDPNGAGPSSSGGAGRQPVGNPSGGGSSPVAASSGGSTGGNSSGTSGRPNYGQDNSDSANRGPRGGTPSDDGNP